MASVLSIRRFTFGDLTIAEGDHLHAVPVHGDPITGHMEESAIWQGELLDLYRDTLPAGLRDADEVFVLQLGPHVVYFTEDQPPTLTRVP